MKKLGLYVHFPFCIQKCNYCDFISFSGLNEDIFIQYCHAIAKEIKSYGRDLKEYSVDSVFFGGGTPSLLSQKELDIVVDSIYTHFHISDKLEFTIESNPRTLNTRKLKNYLKLGINRLSIGVQTLNDELLRDLGRIHTVADFYENYYEARNVGFKNINTDLMFSIPNQRMSNWEDTAQKILELQPEHISFYGLKIEENTPFYNMLQKGELHENDEESDRKMYDYIVTIFNDFGYHQYEISNAAKLGYQCRHNLKYWTMNDYLGIGTGAHSYLKGIRFSNECDLNKYIENANNNVENIVWKHINDENDEISEFIFTGLRLTNGMDLKYFKKRFGFEIQEMFEKELDKLIKGKWLKIENERLSLTQKGIYISNSIMSEFIL